MIPYSDFQLTERQVNNLKNRNARKRIRKYIKEHGVEPSCELVQTFYTVTPGELENCRKICYAMAFEKNGCDGIWEGEDTTNHGGTTSGNSGETIESGSTEGNGPESPSTGYTNLSGASASSQFNIGLISFYANEEVQNNPFFAEALGKMRNGIYYGDLIDYTKAEIKLTNLETGTIIQITDLTKTYDIPDGDYKVEGWVGRTKYVDLSGAGARPYHDWGYKHPDTYLIVYGVSGSGSDTYSRVANNKISLSLFHGGDSLVISDKPFTAENLSAYEYKSVYYMFVRNEYRRKGASWTPVVDHVTSLVFKFGDISYTLTSFVPWTVYYIGGEITTP